MSALPLSVLQSYMLVIGLVFFVCFLVALASLLPLRVDAPPELRGPARGEPWSLWEKVGAAGSVLGLVAALAIASGVLGPSLDQHDRLSQDKRGKTAYASAE